MQCYIWADVAQRLLGASDDPDGGWEGEIVKSKPFRDRKYLPVELHKRVRKYAFDQEVTLSTVMVDAIEAWLDGREG